ncbi:DUF2125 domain-containing protein [Actibacterium sp. 188UL27-1]|uniref:DUF2125 domain-containing protein n=1 Tax=Actibacterium sp. 188UL27-1 TaxID=2786961 RepID=UPI00195644B6|nr:DUF2125 domain-containing protein [Actibacterium sp. 188UL27-1]MBM7066080.1 DUF2125 domain-containing protein [Actibacterium sp. 188UL27-1]
MLTRLLIAICAAGVLWGGTWFWGQGSTKRDVTDWQAARHAEGWQADWADHSVAGFPNRYDVTLTDVALADPQTGWAWRAPFFQVLRLRYRPNHLILIWPETQTLQNPHQTLTITSEQFRASLVYGSGDPAVIERVTIVENNVAVASTTGWTVTGAELRMASRPGDDPKTVDLGLAGTGLRLTGLPIPDVGAAINADLTATFDRPWDARALNDRRPQIDRLTIRNINARLGQLTLRIAGTLTADPDGRAVGDVLVKATNWRDILDLAVATGALPEAVAPPISTALEAVSKLAGHPDTLDIPISFQRGLTRVGPVPIGPAPSLRIP